MKFIVELMTNEVEKVDVTWSVLQVIAMMREKKIGSVVVEQNGDPVGIFTERDLMTRVDLTRPTGLLSVGVDEVMTPVVIAVEADKSLIEVVRTMRKHSIRHLPVTKDNKIVGLVSSRDLLEHYQQYLEYALADTRSELELNARNSMAALRRFQKIFGKAHLAIIETDTSHTILSSNMFAKQILRVDYLPEGESMKKFFAPSTWSDVIEQNIALSRDKEHPFHVETEILTDDQKLVPVSLSVGIIKEDIEETALIYIVAERDFE